MAETSLTVTPGSGGGQNPTTQNNLQGSGQASLDNGLTGKVQPGITSDLLKTEQGISLTPTALSTVDLSGTPSSTAPETVPSQDQFNPVLIAFCVVLFAAATIMFIVTNQSGKKHNQYK
jgi:hypothetical protein